MKSLVPILISILMLPLLVGSDTEHSKVNVFWGLLGSYPAEREFNPYNLTRDDKSIDSASLLYSIRREPKSAQQICDETGIHIRKVERKLQELEACELVTSTAEGFIVAFPFWDMPLRDKINELGMELAEQTAALLKAELPRLKRRFEESSLPAQGFEWDDLALTLVGGLLMDTGVGDRGLKRMKVFVKRRDTPVRPGGYLYWYKAVEGGWGQYWKFGHDLIKNDNQDLWFGLFYGRLVGGRRIRWEQAWEVHDPYTREVILPLIEEGKIEVGKLRDRTGLSDEQFGHLLERLERARLVRIESGTIFPAFPILEERDIGNLLAAIDAVSDRIIKEVYLPALPEIRRAWREIKPSNWRIEKVDRFFVREVYDRPYNLTLHKLIEDGILPPSPVEPPFNYWGLKGRFKAL